MGDLTPNELLAIVAASAAQAKDSSFRDAVNSHLTAIDTRNTAAFEATLTAGPVLSFVPLNGRVTRNKHDFKAQMRGWFKDQDWSWSRRELSVSTTGQTGVAVFHIDYSDKDPSGKPYQLSYVLSLVFAKEGGKWRLVHDQNTRVAPN
jgi:ketosteroid isomerase-like protein